MARVAPGGLVYHVLNRAVACLPLFRKEADRQLPDPDSIASSGRSAEKDKE
jgi:hypothetical protein